MDLWKELVEEQFERGFTNRRTLQEMKERICEKIWTFLNEAAILEIGIS